MNKIIIAFSLLLISTVTIAFDQVSFSVPKHGEVTIINPIPRLRLAVQIIVNSGQIKVIAGQTICPVNVISAGETVYCEFHPGNPGVLIFQAQQHKGASGTYQVQIACPKPPN